MKDEIRGEIAWLKDDIRSCEKEIRCDGTPDSARADYQERIRSDKREIKRLEKQLKHC